MNGSPNGLPLCGGKVYYCLNNNLNNDLIKIIQSYNIGNNNWYKSVLVELNNGTYHIQSGLEYLQESKTSNIFRNIKYRRFKELYWYLYFGNY